jgi:hypothetical protein
MDTKTTMEQEIKSLGQGHCLGIMHYRHNNRGTETIEEMSGKLVLTVIDRARKEALACKGDERVDVVELEGVGPFFASDGTKVANTHAPCFSWFTHEQLLFWF